MKFSEWAKEYDSRRKAPALRAMNVVELLSITEWDNQPERSKREDHESGCGALNTQETE